MRDGNTQQVTFKTFKITFSFHLTPCSPSFLYFVTLSRLSQPYFSSLTPLWLSGFSLEAESGKRPHPIIPSVRGKAADTHTHTKSTDIEESVYRGCVLVSVCCQRTQMWMCRGVKSHSQRCGTEPVHLYRINPAGGGSVMYSSLCRNMYEWRCRRRINPNTLAPHGV